MIKTIYVCSCSFEGQTETEVGTHLDSNTDHVFKPEIRYEAE